MLKVTRSCLVALSLAACSHHEAPARDASAAIDQGTPDGGSVNDDAATLRGALTPSSEAITLASPVRVEIVARRKDAADRTGDVVVFYADGRSEQLTEAKHCRDPKLGPDGLVGWTWADAKYKGQWVNSHLHVRRGKKVVVESNAWKPFIEQWAFSSKGVVAKSRALHGPAKIELFSMTDGHRAGAVDAFATDVPGWAKPFTE
jgi:hypothetical protein